MRSQHRLEGSTLRKIAVTGRVPVLDDDTEDTLSARILRQEHRIYPQAVRWFAEGRLQLDGMKVRIQGEQAEPATLISPVLS